MIVVTPKQMRDIDAYTINNIGIPGSVLMENAAAGLVHEMLKDFGTVDGKSICLFAGKGNNGGDAFAVARHLHNKGANVIVIIMADKKDITGDALLNLQILDKMGIDAIEVLDRPGLSEVELLLDKADIIVDGLFGTGLKGNISGLLGETITLINEKNKPVISVDIPSGINGETGEILGTCVKADKTVTFGFPKLGHFLHPGCEYTGELVVCDISIPKVTVDNFEIKNFTIDSELVKSLLPKRKANSNKGDYGKVLIVTGSLGMTGAGCLSGGAALRTGAGLVYLAVPSSLVSIYDSNLIEAVTIPVKDDSGVLSIDALPQVLEKLVNVDAAAVGPGLSTKGDAVNVVRGLIEESTKPLVIDADGINAIAKDISILNRKKSRLVLTPHPGEMARLLGTSTKEVQSNRIKIAQDFSTKWDVVTVLKGSKTIVALPDGRVYINCTGNSGMATGGTGDVLTGIIVSLIGQGMDPNDAAIAGVYLHGLCGDSAAKIKGEHGLIAGDLVTEIPYVIKGLNL